MLGEFDLEIPQTLENALDLMAGGAAPLAGGTTMLVDMRAGRERPDSVVSLARLDGLRWIEARGGRMAIGGGATVSDLLNSPEIAEQGASLVEAAKVFAGQMVRNTATVAGNIASGSPAADLVPPLMALDAALELTGKAGARSVALADYYTGYKQDIREPGELITAISWPLPGPGSADLFYKLARRKGDAITVTGVAVSLTLAGGECANVRIALGAVAPVVMRARTAEAVLEGQAPSPDLFDRAGQVAAAECNPIDDVRAGAGYRRHCVHMLVRRLVSQAVELSS